MQGRKGSPAQQAKAHRVDGGCGELEALAARQDTTRITPQLLSELEDLIEETHALAKAGDAHGHSLKNTQFHGTVISAAPNSNLERLWRILEPYSRTYVTALSPDADLVWLGDRHVAIVEALRACNRETNGLVRVERLSRRMSDPACLRNQKA